MPPPPNTTAATATVMTDLPYDVTLDVTEAPGTFHPVWWRYTAVAGDTVIGVWAESVVRDGYRPYIPEVLVGSDPDALEPLGLDISGYPNAPIQFPVTAGETYYLRIENSVVTWPETSSLHVNALRAPCGLSAPGAIAIPDDTAGFPMPIFQHQTGTLLQFRLDFPAGEVAHVLPNGYSVWEDKSEDALLRLYTSSFDLAQSPPTTFVGGTAPSAITSNGDDRFYVGTFGGGGEPARFGELFTDGSTGTTWTLPATGLTAIGISRDGTVAYVIGQAGSAGAVQRWDLSAETMLTPPLAATVGGYATGDLIVLPDESVLVAYRATGAAETAIRRFNRGGTKSVIVGYAARTSDAFVRRYSPTGTILQTYAFPGLQLNHLTEAPASLGEAFWAWFYLETDSSRFILTRLSDGAVLESFDSPWYEGGAYQPGAPTNPPTARFGHSFSCPFVSLPMAVPCPGAVTPSPSYHIEERIIRRLRRTPHVNNDNKRVFYRTFELDLERGVGLATGQGSDPLVMLRLSRDGGHTWGEPMTMSAGQLGVYTQRVIARRLGQARDCVFEVTVSDPVAWSLVNAWLELEAGTH